MPLVLVSILGWETQENVSVSTAALAPLWVPCHPGSQRFTDIAPSPAQLASPTALPETAAMPRLWGTTLLSLPTLQNLAVQKWIKK